MWCNEMAFFDLFVKADKKIPVTNRLQGFRFIP